MSIQYVGLIKKRNGQSIQWYKLPWNRYRDLNFRQTRFHLIPLDSLHPLTEYHPHQLPMGLTYSFPHTTTISQAASSPRRHIAQKTKVAFPRISPTREKKPGELIQSPSPTKQKPPADSARNSQPTPPYIHPVSPQEVPPPNRPPKYNPL